MGQKKAVGIGLMCGIVTTMVDAWLSGKYNGVQGKVVGHAVLGTVVGVLGGAVYWT